jgi:hypothetical protein
MKIFSWKLAARVFLVVVGLDAALLILGWLTYDHWLVDITWWIVNSPGFAFDFILFPPIAAKWDLTEWDLMLLLMSGGLFSAFVWSSVAGYVFRREHGLKIAIGTPLALIGIYIGTFSCCWFLSPSQVTLWQGRKVHEVSFRAIDDRIWKPAFWFVEHVCGYENYQYAAGMENGDIYVFTRFLDAPDTAPEPKATAL